MFTPNLDIRALIVKQKQLSNELYEYPHDSLHAIISELLFRHDLVHDWQHNEFSSVSEIEQDYQFIDNQFSNLEPYECIRFASARNRNEYFESRHLHKQEFLVIFFPDSHKHKAEIVQTNIDLRRLKGIKKMIDTFNNEFPNLVKRTVEEKLSISNEIEMLKTYAEVAGE